MSRYDGPGERPRGMGQVTFLVRQRAVQRASTHSYRDAQTAADPREAVDLMWVRTLMLQPVIPAFLARIRLLDAGQVTLPAGAGRASITRVEVSTDGVDISTDPQLALVPSRFAMTGLEL